MIRISEVWRPLRYNAEDPEWPYAALQEKLSPFVHDILKGENDPSEENPQC